jgi:hypothetical protein
MDAQSDVSPHSLFIETECKAMTSSTQLDRSRTITPIRSTATSDTFDVQHTKEEQRIVLPDYYKLNPEAAERKRIKYLQRAEAITAES